MTKIIGVVQLKGGAGRSTLATNLAGELSRIGKTVIIDCDMPQGTSASWYAVRQEKGRSGNLFADTAADHDDLLNKVAQYQDAKYIVLDSPPRIAGMTRAALMIADLCLIPVGASKAEIWATGDILALVEQANQIKPIKARMVWTRHRGRTNLAKELTKQAETELGLPILKTVMTLRVGYTEALGDGLTIAELAGAEGKQELKSLVDEIQKIVSK